MGAGRYRSAWVEVAVARSPKLVQGTRMVAELTLDCEPDREALEKTVTRAARKEVMEAVR